MKFKMFSKVWVIYALLAFPSFYFVYKFGNPDFGTNDFFSYYKLYKNWDFYNVDAPFNMRILSSFFVYVFNKIGFHYDTLCAFDKFNLDKQVFFNAILFNYICIIFTCTVVFFTVKKYIGNIFLSFGAGLIYLLGFGTLFYEFMPITDALSVLLFAIVFNGYLSKSYYIIIPLLLLIIQREYIFLALGLIALMDMLKYKERYYLYILITCVFCFALYFVLRKTVFYTPKYDHQASPAYFLESIFKIQFPLLENARQTIMTLNTFIIYILIVGYKKIKGIEIDRFNLLKIILLFAQINIISFAAVFGNNTGRYFYILIPLVIFQLIKEVKPLIPNTEITADAKG